MLYLARLAFLIYTSLLITLCLINIDDIGISPVMQWDKLLHTLAYFTFATLGLLASCNLRQYLIILGLGFLLGISLEFAQSGLTDYRSASMLDQVANSLGLIISLVISKLNIVQRFWPLTRGLWHKE
jgi:VanZ family protein